MACWSLIKLLRLLDGDQMTLATFILQDDFSHFVGALLCLVTVGQGHDLWLRRMLVKHLSLQPWVL